MFVVEYCVSVVSTVSGVFDLSLPHTSYRSEYTRLHILNSKWTMWYLMEEYTLWIQPTGFFLDERAGSSQEEPPLGLDAALIWPENL